MLQRPNLQRPHATCYSDHVATTCYMLHATATTYVHATATMYIHATCYSDHVFILKQYNIEMKQSNFVLGVLLQTSLNIVIKLQFGGPRRFTIHNSTTYAAPTKKRNLESAIVASSTSWIWFLQSLLVCGICFKFFANVIEETSFLVQKERKSL